MSDPTFGCQVASYGAVRETVELARAAEDAGFDAVSLPDHLFHPRGAEDFLVDPPWEAFTVLGALGVATDGVDLLPGVADTVRRHPTLLAHATVTLDRLSGGRAALGLGAGEAFNVAPVADFDWSKPFTRFRESLEVIRGLWDATEADPLTYRGEFFELESAALELVPVREPHPPVYVGGYGPKMRALTGRVGDGWLPWIYSPDVYAADRERVRAAAADADRDPDSLEYALMIPTAVSTDADAAVEAAVRRTRVSLALRPGLLDAMGYPAVADATPPIKDLHGDASQVARLREAAADVPEAAVREVVVAGSPDDAVSQLEAFLDAGVTRPVVIPVGDIAETLTHYGETVLPAVRSGA